MQVKGRDVVALSTFDLLPGVVGSFSAAARDAVSLSVSASVDVGASWASIKYGLILPLGSGRENISLAGELK